MAWIESHQTLGAHPKVRRFAVLLSVPVPQVIGHLHLLWHWALDHAEDGDVSRYDALDLALAAQWTGDAQELKDALIGCGPGGSHGFLELDGPCGDPADSKSSPLVLHDWWTYAGKLVARRERDRELARARRSDAASKTVARRSDASPSDNASPARRPARRPARVTVNPTEQNQDQNLKPLSPSGDTRDPPDDGFDAFWAAWPRRNGKKLARDKAHRAWTRLTLPQRRDAYRGARNYADASNASPPMAGAKDAFRWLQGREWPDWQEPAVAEGGSGLTRLASGEEIPW